MIFRLAYQIAHIVTTIFTSISWLSEFIVSWSHPRASCCCVELMKSTISSLCSVHTHLAWWHSIKEWFHESSPPHTTHLLSGAMCRWYRTCLLGRINYLGDLLRWLIAFVYLLGPFCAARRPCSPHGLPSDGTEGDTVTERNRTIGCQSGASAIQPRGHHGFCMMGATTHLQMCINDG